MAKAKAGNTTAAATTVAKANGRVAKANGRAAKVATATIGDGGIRAEFIGEELCLRISTASKAMERARLSNSGRSRLIATSQGWAWLQAPSGATIGVNVSCIVPLRQRNQQAR